MQASYGSSTKPGSEGMAVVEMAAASGAFSSFFPDHADEVLLLRSRPSLSSGLEKVPLEQRNPLHTTTEGTGELMQHAYDAGHRRIIVGMVR